ncbi:DNA-binding PadR family transcriptional regulator [Nocardia transvalensis]|uniref:DNA-binding PadR family transcriptional regulator n=1 Tax=Nocardia transvalensis TaxID=37333 RepID=A0A7W9PF78_9NOCA|nr:PadR family transcriptional regulator [Nocardia transvalensis]MBB5914982.1 DNA-binding PadR family transcriptional regulator [Nocardia transvalensis]
MAKKRKVGNLLALAVLAALLERPMHRYEIAAVLKERGKERDMDIKWGSLYTVVQNLEKHGFLEVVGSERDGARPERVIYRITDPGRAELEDWTRELVSLPEYEHHRFVAGLSIVALLPPDEVITLLGDRATTLRQVIATEREELAAQLRAVPRLFLIEVEFQIAMLEAEVAWVDNLRAELAAGDFPGVDFWRYMHAAGIDPGEVADMVEKGGFTGFEEA